MEESAIGEDLSCKRLQYWLIRHTIEGKNCSRSGSIEELGYSWILDNHGYFGADRKFGPCLVHGNTEWVLRFTESPFLVILEEGLEGEALSWLKTSGLPLCVCYYLHCICSLFGIVLASIVLVNRCRSVGLLVIPGTRALGKQSRVLGSMLNEENFPPTQWQTDYVYLRVKDCSRVFRCVNICMHLGLGTQKGIFS